jgi:DNA-binding NarL/FixJ family response regulator
MDNDISLTQRRAQADGTCIYLIEDDLSILHFLRQTLLQRPSWRLLGHSASLAHAREHALSSSANVFLVDLCLPDGCGEDLLALLVRHKPEAELLVFTVFGEESRLLCALAAGATGYVLKGCSPEQLVLAIEQIREGGAPISPLLARMLLKQFRSVPTAPVALKANPALLSERETDVLKLLAQGYVNKEIASKLAIGPATVGSHVKNLYLKLAVHTRLQAVLIAQKRGLL